MTWDVDTSLGSATRLKSSPFKDLSRVQLPDPRVDSLFEGGSSASRLRQIKEGIISLAIQKASQTGLKPWCLA